MFFELLGEFDCLKQLVPQISCSRKITALLRAVQCFREILLLCKEKGELVVKLRGGLSPHVGIGICKEYLDGRGRQLIFELV